MRFRFPTDLPTGKPVLPPGDRSRFIRPRTKGESTLCAPASGCGGMKPMVKVQRDPASSVQLRLNLSAAPPEYFHQYFAGRDPSPEEKAEFIERAVEALAPDHVYENDLYHVEVKYTPPFAHLYIRRHDGLPCNEWHDLQQIKNEIVGPENEAMKIFPGGDRPSESPGECCLCVHTDPTFRFSSGAVAPFRLIPTDGRGVFWS